MTGPSFALIPVNRLDRAKGRLAELLTPTERRELALITFRTVLNAVRGAGWHTVVLTSDPAIAEAAGLTAHVLEEAPGVHGLNPQLEAAIARLLPELDAADDPRLLVLHADLPLVTVSAVAGLTDAAGPRPSATAVRSADGGTNAMLLRPPGLFPLAYGESSFAKHAAAAHAAGVAFNVFESEELALDLDTPADVAALLSSAAGRASAAGRHLLAAGVRSRLLT